MKNVGEIYVPAQLSTLVRLSASSPYIVHDVVTSDIIQIMNGYECNGTDISMRLEMECSIQRGKAELNRTFYL